MSLLADPARGQRRTSAPSCEPRAASRVARRMRAMAREPATSAGAGRDEGGRRRLSALGTVEHRAGAAAARAASPNATASSAPRPIRRCSARLDLKVGDRITVGAATARDPRGAAPPSRTSSPPASASARGSRLAGGGCAPPAWSSPAAWCAGPTACSCRRPTRATALRRRWSRGRASGLARGRLGDPHARQRRRRSFERNIERFTQFLTLVGLTALLVGGVGVANAVRAYLDRKRDVIATLKSLGATGGRVFAIYLIAGDADRRGRHRHRPRRRRALPFAIGWRFGAVLPVPHRAGAACRRAWRSRRSTAC